MSQVLELSEWVRTLSTLREGVEIEENLTFIGYVL